MARSTISWMGAAVVALATQTAAQQCYYPNGSDAPEKACSTAAGSACCPDKWECLDNGLCYYPANDLYGRYSCTDKSWNSPGCPSNMCTYDMSASGGESITQCSNHDNQWCCNADATHVNCCQESPSPRPFFALQDRRAYATVGQNQASSVVSLAQITGLASASGASSAASSTSAPASSTRVSSQTAASSRVVVSSANPVTSVVKSVSSGAAGVVTVERTIISTPSAAAAANPAGSSSTSNKTSSNIGLIVGCAAGVPLGLALVGILLWMLRKRRQQKANPYKEASETEGSVHDSPAFAGGAATKLGKKDVYKHSKPGTTEIDSNPIGPGRPVSNIPGRAELASGTGFQPGRSTAYTPDTVGIGGGMGDGRSTWESAPPGYSPGTNQAAFSHSAGATELADTSVMPVINEKSDAPQYQAYRPTQPIAELPTVMTPPEDVEKQLPK